MREKQFKLRRLTFYRWRFVVPFVMALVFMAAMFAYRAIQPTRAVTNTITVTDNNQIIATEQSASATLITRTSVVNVKDVGAVDGYDLTAAAASNMAGVTATIASAGSSQCPLASPCALSGSPMKIFSEATGAAAGAAGHTTTYEVKITVPANASIGNYVVDIAYDETPIVIIPTKIIADGSNIQNVTAAMCSGATVFKGNNTGAISIVKDSRDSHYYAIAKLADNNCWMLTNLAYGGSEAGTQFKSGAGSNAETCNPSASMWCQQPTPARNTKQWLNPASTSITQSPDYTRCGAAFRTTAASIDYTECGYLYNWCAALGNANSSCSIGFGGGDVANAGVGLCPSGWRLPKGSPSGEFSYLDGMMHGDGGFPSGSDSTYSANWQNSGIWRGVMAGNFYPGTGLVQQGTDAHYWSATIFSDITAFTLHFSRYIVTHAGGGGKWAGMSVRCVDNF